MYFGIEIITFSPERRRLHPQALHVIHRVQSMAAYPDYVVNVLAAVTHLDLGLLGTFHK